MMGKLNASFVIVLVSNIIIPRTIKFGTFTKSKKIARLAIARVAFDYIGQGLSACDTDRPPVCEAWVQFENHTTLAAVGEDVFIDYQD